LRKIKASEGTTRTLVHDLSLGGFSIGCDCNHFKTVGTAIVLSGVQRDNKVRGLICLPTGTHSIRIIGEPGVVEPFFQGEGFGR